MEEQKENDKTQTQIQTLKNQKENYEIQINEFEYFTDFKSIFQVKIKYFNFIDISFNKKILKQELN